MIDSYRKYLEYLEADRIALQRNKSLKMLFLDDIWCFQRLMRKLEYLVNCNGNIAKKLLCQYRYRRLSKKLGFTIPINVFGPGLSIAHQGTIVVNEGASVGANCRLHVCTNIGTAAGEKNSAPKLGNNCYIGPGAKLFGNIEIGNNVAIGANAVVNKSFGDNVTIAGIPANIISHKDSSNLLTEGYKIT
ncbi:serine O-acetyltransferase [Vibrio breoganii]